MAALRRRRRRSQVGGRAVGRGSPAATSPRKLRNADLMRHLPRGPAARASPARRADRAGAGFRSQERRFAGAVWLARGAAAAGVAGETLRPTRSRTRRGCRALGVGSGRSHAGQTARRGAVRRGAEARPAPQLVRRSRTPTPSPSVPSLEPAERAPAGVRLLLAGPDRQGRGAPRGAGSRSGGRLLSRADPWRPPRAAVGPGKVCYALQAAGDVPGTPPVACRTALDTSSDRTRTTTSTSCRWSCRGPGRRRSRRAQGAERGASAPRERRPSWGALPWMFRCEVALRFSDHDELTTCTREADPAGAARSEDGLVPVGAGHAGPRSRRRA